MSSWRAEEGGSSRLCLSDLSFDGEEGGGGRGGNVIKFSKKYHTNTETAF